MTGLISEGDPSTTIALSRISEVVSEDLPPGNSYKNILLKRCNHGAEVGEWLLIKYF